MAKDILDTVVKVEAEAEVLVQDARRQAAELKEQSRQTLDQLSGELAADFEQKKTAAEQQARTRREQGLAELEQRFDSEHARIEQARTGKLAAQVERAVKAFTEDPRGN